MKVILCLLLLFSFTVEAEILCSDLFPISKDKKSYTGVTLTPALSNQKLKNISNAEIARLEKMSSAEFSSLALENKFSSEEGKLAFYVFRAAYLVENFDPASPDSGAVLGQINQVLFATHAYSKINFESESGLKIRNKILKILEFYDNVHLPLGIEVRPSLIKLSDVGATEAGRSIMQKLVAESVTRLEHLASAGSIKPAALKDLVVQTFNKVAGRPYKKTVVSGHINQQLVVLATDPLPKSSGSALNGLIENDIVYSYYNSSRVSFGKNLYDLAPDLKLEVTISKGALRPMTKNEMEQKAFNTQAMWRDGYLTGAIIIGSDMTTDAKVLAGEYKAYYQDSGFSFKPAYMQKGFRHTFENWLTSGSLDYFLKEDNGSGNVADAPYIMEGHKKTAKGIERVFIIYKMGDYHSGGPMLAKEEIPALVNKANSPALVYVNTTCYAHGCKPQLVASVINKNFTFIASTTAAQTFTNENVAPIMHILNGIRAGHSYSRVRANIKKNKVVDDYTDADDNDYIFPGDSSGVNDPTNISSHSYTFKTQFVDQSGRVLSIEDVLK